MKPSELIDIINEIENKFPVEKWVINKIHIWPLVRFELKLKLFYSCHFKEKKPRYLVTIYRLLKSYFKYSFAMLADSKNNASINGKVDAVFSTYSLTRTPLKGFWYDRFSETYIDVLQSLNMKTLSLEAELDDYDYRIPRYRPSLFIQHKVDLIRIRNKLLKVPPKLDNEALEGFSDFLIFLKTNNYGFLVPLLEKLRYQVNVISELSDYFLNIFNKIKPEIAFVTAYYASIDKLAFNFACRRANIPCVDIQHGTTGEYNIAYGRWNKIPENGYELFPSIFWCWSQEEADAILKWSKDFPGLYRVFVGGNLWLNLWKNNNEIVRYYDNKVRQMKSSFKKTAFILYTFDKYFGIPEAVIEAIKSSSEFFYWLIRIHPTQLCEKRKVDKLLRKNRIRNYEIDFATNMPLPALLRQIDVHVTGASSCTKAAEYFGVPTILTHKDGKEFYSQEIVSGTAMYADTKNTIIESIISGMEKKNKNEGFLKESVNNVEIIKKFLDEIQYRNL